jgi:trimeric autotransporter adhesin
LRCSRWVLLASIAGLLVLFGSCGGQNKPPFNATPTVTGVFPPNVTAGSAAFVMSVSGTGFIADSDGATFAYWNGSARSTSLNVQTGELLVQVFASDLAVQNPAVNITVANPAPGGGMSVTPAIFEVVQRLAGLTISSISPSTIAAGNAPFSLTVNGTGFATNDIVLWNGTARTTVIAPMNTTVATAQITAEDVADAGSATVAVSMPNEVTATPSLNFLITSGNNPSPKLSSLSPSSATHGGEDFQMRVSGSGFNLNSNLEWNGGFLATAYISPSELIALVPASYIAAPGPVTIAVENPAPGGGTSTNVMFTIN